MTGRLTVKIVYVKHKLPVIVLPRQLPVIILPRDNIHRVPPHRRPVGRRPRGHEALHLHRLPVPVGGVLAAIVPSVVAVAPAPELRLAPPPALVFAAIVGTFLQVACRPRPAAVARAHLVDADAVAAAVHPGDLRGTGVETVGHVEAGHVESVVAEEVHQSGAGRGHHFRYPTDAVVALVHETAEDGQQGGVDAVAVEDVQVIPAAFGGEFVQVEGDGGVGGVDQPAAFHAQGVVAQAVVDRARRGAEPGKVDRVIRG
jgi:hypothetical protein